MIGTFLLLEDAIGFLLCWDVEEEPCITSHYNTVKDGTILAM
jgi:hypothetical protein